VITEIIKYAFIQIIATGVKGISKLKM